ELEPARAKLLENRRDVFVELEVLRHLPPSLDLLRALGRDRPSPTQRDEDVHRERVPDRIVVQQLRMALEIQRRSLASLLVTRNVELDAVSRRDTCIPLRRQLGPGAAEREVDVEENGARQSHTGAGNLYASG